MDKIKIVAVAKNEAAYLPEWIYYHLRLGIDSVHIYVNNTTDNTISILDKIQKRNKVSFVLADSLIASADAPAICGSKFFQRNRIHSSCYADAYGNTDPKDADWVLFIDVDEYLLPPNGQLGELIEAASDSSVVKVPWLSLTGEDVPFCTLDHCIGGVPDTNHKSMCRAGLADLKLLSSHSARSQGSTGVRAERAYVLHRNLRSREEYLAMLLRSNTSGRNGAYGIKKNRRGWTNKYSSPLNLPASISDGYGDGFDRFIVENQIPGELEIAKEMVLGRSRSMMEIARQFGSLSVDLPKALAGTQVEYFSLRKYCKARLIAMLLHRVFPRSLVVHTKFAHYLKMKLRFWR